MAERLHITPSGIAILFEDGEPLPGQEKGKRRKYLIGQLPEGHSILSDDALDDACDYMLVVGEDFPSVTTLLGILDKPGLPWAAEKLTVAGCIELARNGELPMNVLAALSRMNARELRFRQVWDAKAQRGHLTHDEIVEFVAGRALRPLASIPREDRGFIQGLASFLSDYRPQITESELPVASLKYGFAGRPDFTATVRGIGGTGLFDVKTHESFQRTKPSDTFPDGQLKTPFAEVHIQLGLYEVARRESGYPPTDYRAAVRINAEGEVDVTASWLDPERALAILPAYWLCRDVAPRVKAKVPEPVELVAA
jgi:hypothetical protein